MLCMQTFDTVSPLQYWLPTANIAVQCVQSYRKQYEVLNPWNPRCEYAARVTVLGLCVLISV